MAPSNMVIALNEADQVIAIGTPDVLLGHIVSHLPTATALAEVPDPGDGSTASIIQFFDESGAELKVVISNAWHKVAFVPSGGRADLRELRARMERIIDGRFAAVAQESNPPPLKKPKGGNWPQFLESCAELVNGRQQPAPMTEPDPFDRRGWWHNTFVHGGNV